MPLCREEVLPDIDQGHGGRLQHCEVRRQVKGRNELGRAGEILIDG